MFVTWFGILGRRWGRPWGPGCIIGIRDEAAMNEVSVVSSSLVYLKGVVADLPKDGPFNQGLGWGPSTG